MTKRKLPTIHASGPGMATPWETWTRLSTVATETRQSSAGNTFTVSLTRNGEALAIRTDVSKRGRVTQQLFLFYSEV